MKTNALKSQLESLVDNFVRDLETLVRKSALEAISDALGGAVGGGTLGLSASAPQKAKRGRPARAAAAAAPKQPKASGKRIRRSLDQIGAVADRIHSYVAQHPGKRAEEIKSALKISSKDWPRPVQMLLSNGRLSVKGAKRATTYTAKSK